MFGYAKEVMWRRLLFVKSPIQMSERMRGSNLSSVIYKENGFSYAPWHGYSFVYIVHDQLSCSEFLFLCLVFFLVLPDTYR